MAKTNTVDVPEANEVNVKSVNKDIIIHLPKLKLNDVSNEVLSLKLLLTGFGYSVGKLDNMFDNQTFASMNRFQKVNHIKENDYCDENTWKCLLSIQT